MGQVIMHTLLSLVCSCIFVYILQRAFDFWKATCASQDHLGYRVVFSPASVISSFLPRVKGVNVGATHSFEDKHKPFAAVGWDTYTLISAFPQTRTMVFVADANVIKEVTSSRARFPKPVDLYRSLNFYGHNIIVSEGEEWKKYRKICAPAFSDRNNKLVWDASVDTVQGLFQDVWGGQNVITIDHCVDITLPIALFVIGAAGFGRNISWNDDAVILPGHTMTFKHSLHIVTTDFFFKLVVPDKAMGLTERMRATRRAFEELRLYIVEMIHERQRAEKVQLHDLFSNLLAANDQSLDAATLTEDEIIGNIYMFLVAGHETAAHTLSFTFAMLALYPEEQEKLFDQIKCVVPDNQKPTYEQMPLLTYSMAVFYETLRMFPPVTSIPKAAAEDTSLVTSNIRGEKCTIPIPKGTYVTISVPGIHYNSRYWEDPHTFRPSRFLENWPRDAFLPFSAGARACLGRKFFETEGIAILTMLVSQYKISIKEEPQFAHETFEERKARILTCRPGITLTPLRVPLVFTRRK